jgi:hypothetical protein
MPTDDAPLLSPAGGRGKLHPKCGGEQNATILDKIKSDSVPKWKPTTAYAAGDKVLNPNGDVVTAKTSFTSGASYNASNWNLSSAYAVTDGTPRLVKDTGDTRAGVLDWEFGAAAAGYLFHLRAGVNSTVDEYALGIGTDNGHGGGMLVSHKNDGVGYRLDQQPGSGMGFFSSNHSSNPYAYTDIYAGGGEMIALKNGRGYADGVATAGSTTFTSATAAFTSADIGSTLSTTQPTPTALPAGVTIVSVESATSVTLSAAPTVSKTGVRFIINTRAPLSLQNILRIFDTDGTTLLYQITKGAYTFAAPMTARDANTLGLDLRGTTGQAVDIFRVRTPDQIDVVRVDKDGIFRSSKKTSITNAADITQPVLTVQNYGTSSNAVGITLYSNPAADGLRIIDQSGNTILGRVNKGGYFMTRLNAAPADADVATGELAWWFDATNGAAKLMIKAKQADGTVKTGSVTLA